MKSKIKHLGIIMDGNRRWAASRQLPSFEGHRIGYKKIEDVLRWCRGAEIKILTLYAFSTENWQRSKKEVDFLMKLFHLALTKDIKKLHKNNICVRVIGRKKDLSEKIQKAVKRAEELTKNNTAIILNLAINYGGRLELVDAFNKIIKNPPKEITEDLISKNIYTAGLPDPDLIIRTSGERRLSGFLTWQSAYSEFYFIKRHWPEFSKEDFNDILNDFANRQRRFGK
ncbi:MAG: polyprenyl diphosphate synthase [Candidatus Azambacteria bacterium]|nr:polyprenyl diphosphate synthase [Candidatus Azambacteria bacterium]